MLVLTRKIEQEIQIGPNITITILHVKGQSVSVGIQAPKEVRIVRGELLKQAAKPREEDIFVSRNSRSDVRDSLAQVMSGERFSLPPARRELMDQLADDQGLGACGNRSPLHDFLTARKP